MSVKRILIIQGHPDTLPQRLCRVLADRYAAGARDAGHEVRVIDVAPMDFPQIRSRAQFYAREIPDPIATAQGDIEWSQHIVVFFPVWLGAMPALLKGFFEQVFRPWFTMTEGGVVGRTPPRLGGRTMRLVVTMGMPALIYRVVFGAQGMNAFTRNMKMFTGIKATGVTMIGMTESQPKGVERRLQEIYQAGRRGI